MDAGEVHELHMSRNGKVRKSFSPMFLLGNILIIGGLVMLLSIGGWYAFQSYSNDQQLQQFEHEGALIEPTPLPGEVAGAVPSTPVAEPTMPPPKLSNGPTVADWTNALKKQTDDSPPIRLSIPSVGIDSKVVPVTWKMIPSKNGGSKSEWQVADYAVGHHAGTANPGQIGNVVLSGHVDYRGQVFKDLHNVKKGDEVIVYTEKGQYVYVITDLVLVKEDGATDAEKARNARYMDPTPDQTLTMITCWPYGIDTHRFIAIAKPYQTSESAQSEFIIR
jgi:sortase A